MQAFKFSLRQAMAWRATQLEIEENQLRQLTDRSQAMALETVRLNLVKERAEAAVRQSTVVGAGDLWALAAYRRRLAEELQALARHREQCAQQLQVQRQKVLEAQRQCRLLEKLERRRHAEWRHAADRELENLAAESFLAGWSGRKG